MLLGTSVGLFELGWGGEVWKESDGGFCFCAPAPRLRLRVDRSSHEPSRCGLLSVPCPDCHGSCSVILSEVQPREYRFWPCVRPPLVFTLHTVSMAGLWLKTASSWWCPGLIEYLLSLKTTIFTGGVNLTLGLGGQSLDKWKFIYSSLIRTTLALDSLPSLLPSPPRCSEWFHDFCRAASQETDVSKIPAGFCFRSKTW